MNENRVRPETVRGIAGLAALVALTALAAQCDESGPRVYTAQRYAADQSCLETYAPLGLVEAKVLGAQCSPVCMTLDEDLYVSTVCPPYPAEASLEPEDAPDCAAALASLPCDEVAAEEPDATSP